MGVKQIITDDLTDEVIDSDTKPLSVRVDGQDYDLYLSDESRETFMALVRGEAPLLKKESRPAPPSSSKGTGAKAKTNTHGHAYADVKAWAVANGVKAANGNPVTEDTPRIGQHVYDAYHAAKAN